MNKAVVGCFPFVALSLVGLLVWPFVAGSILIKLALAFWIVGFGVFGLAKLRHGLERRDRYDLRSLRQVQDKVDLANLVADVPLNAPLTVYCHYCGHEYDPRLPACPKCRLTQGHGVS